MKTKTIASVISIFWVVFWLAVVILSELTEDFFSLYSLLFFLLITFFLLFSIILPFINRFLGGLVLIIEAIFLSFLSFTSISINIKLPIQTIILFFLSFLPFISGLLYCLGKNQKVR